MAKIDKAQVARERDWQINSAMNTLNDYNKLMKDGGLMRDVHKKAQEQLNMVASKLKMGGSVKKAAPKKATKKITAKKVLTKKKK